jgi:hypothetical protein
MCSPAILYKSEILHPFDLNHPQTLGVVEGLSHLFDTFERLTEKRHPPSTLEVLIDLAATGPDVRVITH